MTSILFAYVATLCLGLTTSAPSLILTTDPTPPPLPTAQGYRIHPVQIQVDPPVIIQAIPVVEEGEHEEPQSQPIIYQFDINSNISNRFAKTLVTSKVKNPETKAKEATFTVILPEKAFISAFVMEIDGKSYNAYVKEKEEAKKIYDQAVQQGQSAGHVAVSARDSNRFSVSVNIEAEKKATFLLTYEELLERRNNQYELVLNIHPGQIVKDMNIEVFINESRPLKFVRTPSLRSGNEVSKNDDKLKPETQIEIINSTSAVAKFEPNSDQQKDFAKELGGKENEGLAGQFVLQYDVERDTKGEILLQDGYFVHFFAPDDLEPLPKHVVFVLDTSGSMSGSKIIQLRAAMVSILDELREVDSFHIVEFNTLVYVWDIEKQERIQAKIDDNKEPFEELLKKEYPAAVPATKDAIEKGKQVIQKLTDEDLTNILDSLETALHLVNVNLRKNKEESKFKQPIIIFLTDGEPTVGQENPEEITKIVTKINSERDQVPIFSLSFGDGADRSFLRKVSLKNNGFSRHIYEAADASLQLQEFYKQISSPLLSNVDFKYTSDVKQVTRNIFPIFFRGSELVTAGKTEGDDLKFEVQGYYMNGTITLQVPEPIRAVSSLERLWAYLTIKQKLQERELADNKTQLTKEALDLALKYSFVTDVSSLVVVKPNATSAVDTEDASKSDEHEFSSSLMSVPLYQPVAFPQSALMCSGPGGQVCGKYFCVGPQCSKQDSDSDSDSDLDPGFYPTAIVPKSSATVAPPQSYSPRPSVKLSLPWINSVLDKNDAITVNGRSLELGESAFVLSRDECTGTPWNATEIGACMLIKNCPQVFAQLTDFKIYEKFACVLENKYAGVCCPTTVPPSRLLGIAPIP